MKLQFGMTRNNLIIIKMNNNRFLLQKTVLDYMNNYIVLNPDEMKPNLNPKDHH